MKKTKKLLPLLLAALMLIQVAPLNALGDSYAADTYEAEKQDETPNGTVEDTEAQPEGGETPDADALAVTELLWKNAASEDALAVLTDGMTVTCNYLQIEAVLNRAPEAVSVTVDGVAAEAKTAEGRVALFVELLNGYHTFEITADGAVVASFGLTVNGDDAAYPEVSVQGAAMILGHDGLVTITADNLTAKSVIKITMTMTPDMKVTDVEIAKGYTAIYSWYRGEFIIELEVHDPSKITGAMAATLSVQASVLGNGDEASSWTVESAEILPPEGGSIGTTENFQGTVSVPETVFEITSLYTVEGALPYAVAGTETTLLAKDKDGQPAAGLSVYAIQGKKNILLGVTDENGALTVEHFAAKGIYQVFVADESGAASFAYDVTTYQAVGSEDGAPYAILFDGVFADGKNLTWMSHVLGSKDAAVVRVSTSADMADAILYEGVAETYFYDTDLRINRVHNVAVRDLAPGVYYYQVGDGETWSETKAFTVKSAGETVNVAILGDMGNASAAQMQSIANAIAGSGLTYDFAIQAGNSVSDASSYEAWLNAAESIATLGGIDVIHAPGPNEAENTLFPGVEKDYVYYLYGNVFVAVVNYTEDAAALEETLHLMGFDARGVEADWQVLVLHRSADTTDAEKADAAAATLVPKIAERAGIDLVLSGVEGFYGRTEPVREGTVSEKNGVIYMACGSVGMSGSAVTDGSFAVTEDTYNALYVSLTVTDGLFKVTVYEVKADGSANALDHVTLNRFLCNDGEHMYRWDYGFGNIICDFCDHEIAMKDHIGVIALRDGYMYVNGKGFSKGWQQYNGQTYYFDGKTFKAVNGEQTIDGCTYVFENYVLTEGCWIEEDGVKKLMWGGKVLTSTWHTQGGVTYFFLSNGAYATGTMDIPVVENGEIVMKTFVFDENGALISE